VRPNKDKSHIDGARGILLKKEHEIINSIIKFIDEHKVSNIKK
jgi:hypothetical protein